MKFSFKEMFKSESAELAKIKADLDEEKIQNEMYRNEIKRHEEEIAYLKEKLKNVGIMAKLKNWFRF